MEKGGTLIFCNKLKGIFLVIVISKGKNVGERFQWNKGDSQVEEYHALFIRVPSQ